MQLTTKHIYYCTINILALDVDLLELLILSLSCIVFGFRIHLWILLRGSHQKEIVLHTNKHHIRSLHTFLSQPSHHVGKLNQQRQ